MNRSLGHCGALIIEVVGPAGAGKTTLVQALTQRCGVVRAGVPIGRMRHLWFLFATAVSFLPLYLRLRRQSRWFTWRELRSMVYVQAWHGLLVGVGPRKMVTVLDHGPIYRLAHLQEFGPELTRDPAFELWWNRQLSQWSAILDRVVWLDAPDEVLLERIRTRNVAHVIKDKSAVDAFEFLCRYRQRYERILDLVTVSDSCRVTRFHTDTMPVDDMAETVLADTGCR